MTGDQNNAAGAGAGVDTGVGAGAEPDSAARAGADGDQHLAGGGAGEGGCAREGGRTGGGDVTLLFAGGGTGGHLYPGIAVARALQQIAPNVRPLFLCTQREIDRTILAPTGLDYIQQPIVPPVKTVGGLLKFWKSWRETKDLLKTVLSERNPRAVLGLGGYAAGPAVRMAASAGAAAAILNPDVIPGHANQFLLKAARSICCQFDETREHLPPSRRDKMIVTGCPIRPELTHLPPRPQAAARLGVDPMLHTLTITGASQGAQTVNQAVCEVLKGLKLQGWNVLHLAGRDHAAAVRAEYREMNLPAVVIDFTPDMADVWAVTDLCVSRSGASTVAELAACAVPSILFPYPFHKDQHQKANAQVLASAGGAVVLSDERSRRKNADQLREVLEPLLYDAPRRQQMSAAARSRSHPDAAGAVARVLAGMLGG